MQNEEMRSEAKGDSRRCSVRKHRYAFRRWDIFLQKLSKNYNQLIKQLAGLVVQSPNHILIPSLLVVGSDRCQVMRCRCAIQFVLLCLCLHLPLHSYCKCIQMCVWRGEVMIGRLSVNGQFVNERAEST